MSTLIENVEKVTAAHAALKEAIAAKGVNVPDGAKLTDMPALVGQISTEPVPTNQRAVFTYGTETTIVVPKMMVVDMTATDNLKYFFYGCNKLQSLTLPDGFGSSATNIDSCFKGCSSLASIDLSSGFGQFATNINDCFRGCFDLKHLTLPDGFGQNAEYSESCFFDCKSLTSLTLPDGFGQASKDVNHCFRYCKSLTSLTLPDGFGQKAYTTELCFDGCSALTTITGNPNFKVSISLSYSPKLTHDSLMVVINGLQTVTTTQTLTLGSTNLAKLTDDEKKVATDKGWTLA